MKKVLIISPHFPPTSAVDMHRVRLSMPYFRHFGWEAFVLAVDPHYIEGIKEPLLEKSIPGDSRIFHSKALPLHLSNRVGLGNLGLRALPYLYVKGNELIREHGVDLVYFSTTMFPVMSLGARWLRKWGVPYVLDFQDPWLNSYYDAPGAPEPPGGKIKYKVSQSIARYLEPRAMRGVSHVISVSPNYPQVLRQRYPALKSTDFTVLPFGAAEKDFESVAALGVKQNVFDPNDGKKHFVYVGVAGAIMAKALRGFFQALSQMRDQEPERFRDLRLHFVGTAYAPAGRAVKTVEPLAREYGVADLVEERTGRVPYFEALKILLDSDAILLFGSDDPGYTASKLYPCILARRPILAVLHEESTVVDVLRRCNAGRAVTFRASEAPEDLTGEAARQLDWLLSLPEGYRPETNWPEFEPYTAREMTRRQCEVFHRCVPAA
jgi:hypothetical protein